MKLKDTLALIKAGYTREEIKAFDNEDPEPEKSSGDGVLKALGLMADQLNALQAAYTKGSAAEPDNKEDDISVILAKLQGSGEEEE